MTAADRLPAPRLATSLTYCRAARGAATWRAGLRLLGELGMRLARLLRGAASAGPAPRTVRSSASRCLTSDSGSGPAPERGVPGQVDFYARFSPSPLSMKQFLDFGECCAGLGPLCAALLASALPSSSTFSFPHPQPLGCCFSPPQADPYAQVQELAGRVSNWGRVSFYCVLLKTNQVGLERNDCLPCGARVRIPAGGQAPSEQPRSGERQCVHPSKSRVQIVQNNDKCPILYDDCIKLARR